MKKIIFTVQVFTLLAAFPLLTYSELTHLSAPAPSTINESPVIKDQPASPVIAVYKMVLE